MAKKGSNKGLKKANAKRERKRFFQMMGAGVAALTTVSLGRYAINKFMPGGRAKAVADAAVPNV